LFNRPAWSKPQVIINTDANDFFNRSDETYATIAAREQARRKRKIAKKKAEATSTSEESGSSKRRHISGESDSGSESDESSSDEGVISIKSSDVDAKEAKTIAESSSPARPRVSPRSSVKTQTTAVLKAERLGPAQASIIALDDDSDEQVILDTDDELEIVVVKKAPALEYDDTVESEEEFPELAREAREKGKAQQLNEDLAAGTSSNPTQSAVQDLVSQDAQPLQQPTPPRIEEPIVSILISSTLPNTRAIIFNRRLSQRLKDVRLVWAQKQGFSEEVVQSIILVWRGKRMFDATSCKSMGIGLDADGNVVMKGEKDFLGEENREIHMEAMTEEMFENARKEKERQAQGIESEGEDEDETFEVPEKVHKIRIIVKGRGFEDFKLLVKEVGFTSIL
jgi:hypothetical protein